MSGNLQGGGFDGPARPHRHGRHRRRPQRTGDEPPALAGRPRPRRARAAGDARWWLAGPLGRVPARLAELDHELPGPAVRRSGARRVHAPRRHRRDRPPLRGHGQGARRDGDARLAAQRPGRAARASCSRRTRARSRRSRLSSRPAASTGRTSQRSRQRCRSGSPPSTPSTTAANRTCRPARCSSSAAPRPAASWPRSCKTPGARSTCRSGARVDSRGGTAAVTSSAGSAGSRPAARRWGRACRRRTSCRARRRGSTATPRCRATRAATAPTCGRWPSRGSGSLAGSTGSRARR